MRGADPMRRRRRLRGGLLAVFLVATSLGFAPAPAARAAAPGVTVDGSLGNGIATGAVVNPDPAHALVTVSNAYHFWAGVDLQPPTGNANLAPAPLGTDARGIYGALGLIGPGATSAWTGRFDVAGSAQGVWVHYDLATTRGAEALALTCLTIVADTFGAPLLAPSAAAVQHAVTLITGLADFTNLLGAVQRNDTWEIARAWSLLLQSGPGRVAIITALAELRVIATDAGLKTLGSVVGLIDFARTMVDLVRAGVGGHTSGQVTFAVAATAGAPTAGATATAMATAVPTPSATARAKPGACNGKVGVSWNNYQEPRWAQWDEPAIKAALAAGGATYISSDARSSSVTQNADIQSLISQGAKVLIIIARETDPFRSTVAMATAAGIPVVSYPWLIDLPSVLLVTSDMVEVGRMQARAVFAIVPTGNYVFIKGEPLDPMSGVLRGGQQDIVGAALASGAIKNVGETYTSNWDPTAAQTEMSQILAATGNGVDAVLAENDGMAGGVAAALVAQGMAGRVAISGMDGDAAALNRVALGTQTVDVWNDPRLLGSTAGTAAVALCAGAKIAGLSGTTPFRTPSGNTVRSILVKPHPITKDNLGDVLSAGWITRAELCQGVTPGSVGGCP